MAKLNGSTVTAGTILKTPSGYRMILSCMGKESTGYVFCVTPLAQTTASIQPVAFKKLMSQAYMESMGWTVFTGTEDTVTVTLQQIAESMGVPVESLRICS